MFIRSIDLENFRNYRFLSLEFDPENNIIFGDNAQGKTNLLEACFICAATKSQRAGRDTELINFDSDEAHVKAGIVRRGRDHRIDIHLKKTGKKGIAVDHIPLKKASDLFGILNVVYFSPEDLNIIKEGPSERRRFMDMELCQLDRLYLSDLSEYKRILTQRNILLKEIAEKNRKSDKETLDIWDIQLADRGKRIIESRRNFIESLRPVVYEIHRSISGNTEDPELKYSPDVSENDIENRLFESRDRDIRMGTTTVGPHRDDISFSINDKDVRTYGSEGQKRTCALSLKLSEIRFVENQINDKPVLLLDDVLSELDRKRQNLLLSSLSDVQTIISCTGLNDLVENRFKTDRIIEVVNGRASVAEK